MEIFDFLKSGNKTKLIIVIILKKNLENSMNSFSLILKSLHVFFKTSSFLINLNFSLWKTESFSAFSHTKSYEAENWDQCYQIVLFEVRFETEMYNGTPMVNLVLFQIIFRLDLRDIIWQKKNLIEFENNFC